MIWYFFYNKAQRAEAAGDYAAASKAFDAMMKFNPKPAAKIAFAYHLLRNGEWERAENLLNKFVLTDVRVMGKKSDYSTQSGILAKTTYALVKWQKGEIDDAIKYTENLMKQYKTTTLYSNLGYFYITKGDYDKALEVNTEAYDFSPSDAGICDNLAYTYFKTGKINEACELYERIFANKTPPSFPEAFYNYSLVLESMGNIEKALEYAEKALNLNFTKLISLTRDCVEERCQALRSLLQNQCR